jgi:hypothetical protein
MSRHATPTAARVAVLRHPAAGREAVSRDEVASARTARLNRCVARRPGRA